MARPKVTTRSADDQPRLEELPEDDVEGTQPRVEIPEPQVEPEPQLSLDERLAQAEHQKAEVEKEVRLKKLNADIKSMRAQVGINDKDSEDSESQSEPEYLTTSEKKVLPEGDVVAYRRRTVRPKEIPLYKGKNTKEHIDFKRNCGTTFRIAKEDFPTDESKIAYAIQYLDGTPKDSWYNYEDVHPDHGFTFDRFMQFLLDLIGDPVNRQLDYALQFSEARQKDNQTVREFDTYLTNLEAHLTPYNEEQQVTHLFTKLRPELRDSITNYQQVPTTKAELLVVATRVEGNLNRSKKGSRPNGEDRPKGSKPPGNKRKREDRDHKNAKSGDTKKGKRSNNTGQTKAKPASDTKVKDHSELTCYTCGIKGHISPNCPDKSDEEKKKKKPKVNAVKGQGKAKTPRKARASSEEKDQ